MLPEPYNKGTKYARREVHAARCPTQGYVDMPPNVRCWHLQDTAQHNTVHQAGQHLLLHGGVLSVGFIPVQDSDKEQCDV